MTRTQADTYVKDYLDRMTALEFEIAAAYELEEDDTVYEEDVEDDQDLIALLSELK